MSTLLSTEAAQASSLRYCTSLSTPLRRRTRVVAVGDVPLGGDYPVRLQSMTTTDTMDVAATVAQVQRLVEVGSEYVRLTVPSQKEAEQLPIIKKALLASGCRVPLIADIHFTPRAAEITACYVEKVRINPGNYADKKRFAYIDFSDASYREELDRISERFRPLVRICKREGCAMRIGTNHGSLSDRVMSRYGDTPLGMVESALEFLRICCEESYYEVVLSMKASRPQVMIHAYRLLVQRMEEEQLGPFPLHLGVTEAGDGEDGRIKSALGIGTLLSEGLGDTIRVSLTEPPERELPVAAALRDTYALEKIAPDSVLPTEVAPTDFLPFSYARRPSQQVLDWGGGQLPRVVVDLSQTAELPTLPEALGYRYLPELDKWESNEQAADYIYTGHQGENLPLPTELRQILHHSTWQRSSKEYRYPLFFAKEVEALATISEDTPAFLLATPEEVPSLRPYLSSRPKTILWLQVSSPQGYIHLRRGVFSLKELQTPLCLALEIDESIEKEDWPLRAATELGGGLADGYGNGLCLRLLGPTSPTDLSAARRVAFGVLQAARIRISKTEYIACPSCGRTLFDLEETTARIRSHTSHLKGLKIGVMGCIVNGPGEMADADYGYVGAGKDRITLYRGKEIVRRNVSTAEAVDALITLIQADGKWQDSPKS